MRSDLGEPLMPSGPVRDLNAARDAYASGSAEASRRAHNAAMDGMAVEAHEQSGGRLKGIVFGGLDGILTSFAIIAGGVGAHLDPVALLALGVSNVLADALSMGAGEFLSSRSYNNYVRKEREREAWEMENYPAGEIAEMVELFVARGMSQEDAQHVIQRMAKYKEFFVDLMMTEELSLPVPSDDDGMDSLKDGAIMFIAFALFGMLPLFGFVFTGVLFPNLSTGSLFFVACFITAAALFGLGAFKAKFHDKAYVRSGVETTLLGGVCAAVAYFVGRAVSHVAVASELFAQPQMQAPLLQQATAAWMPGGAAL